MGNHTRSQSQARVFSLTQVQECQKPCLKDGSNWTSHELTDAANCLERHIDGFLRVAHAIVRNMATAQEALQEAYLSWFRNYENYKVSPTTGNKDCALRPWFRGFVVRVAHHVRIRQRRRRENLTGEVDTGASTTELNGLRDLEQLLASVKSLLGSELSEAEYEHLRLRLKIGSSKEVAERLGITPGTEAVRWSRIKRKVVDLARKTLRTEAKQ